MTIKDLIWEFENGSISPYKLVEKLKETETDLKEVSTQDLRNELELRGWQTDNLWHVDDVMQNYECTSENAMDVLKKVMHSDGIIEDIYNSIDDEAEHMEYRRTNNNPFN